MSWFILACILFLLCALLVMAEVLIPSGGLLGILAVVSVVSGVAVCFKQSATAGWIGIVIAIIMIPGVLIIAYEILPKTKFGKNVTLSPPQRLDGDAVPDTPQLKEMAGAIGIAITPLRPVGSCNFSGQRLECVAESGYIDKGKKVKVIKIESTQLTVRVVDENS